MVLTLKTWPFWYLKRITKKLSVVSPLWLAGTLVYLRFALFLLSILSYLYYLCSALSLIETTLWGLKLSGLAYVQTNLWPKIQTEVPRGVGPPSPKLPTFWYPSPHISVALVALNSDLCPTCITLYYSSRNYSPDKKADKYGVCQMLTASFSKRLQFGAAYYPTPKRSCFI